MAEVVELPDGSIQVCFAENGSSILILGALGMGVSPGIDHWHNYEVSALIYSNPLSGDIFGCDVTLEDVRLAGDPH